MNLWYTHMYVNRTYMCDMTAIEKVRDCGFNISNGEYGRIGNKLLQIMGKVGICLKRLRKIIVVGK